MKITHVAAGLTLMLSFVACRQDPAPTAPKWHVLNDQQVQNWQPEKASEIHFRLTGGGSEDIANGNDLITAQVSAEGKFSVTLPTPADAALFPVSELGKGCDAAFTASNAAAKYAMVAPRLKNNKGKYIGTVDWTAVNPYTNTGTIEVYGLAYADREVNFNGEVTCGMGTKVKYQMNLKPGWNLVEGEGNATNMTMTIRVADQKPADLKWWAFIVPGN